MFRTEGRDVPVKLGEFIHSTDRQLCERLNHLFLSYCVGSMKVPAATASRKLPSEVDTV